MVHTTRETLKPYFDVDVPKGQKGAALASLRAAKAFELIDPNLDDLDEEGVRWLHRKGLCIKDNDEESDTEGCFLIPPELPNSECLHPEILTKILAQQLPVDILVWLQDIHPKVQIACIGPIQTWCDKNPGKLGIPGMPAMSVGYIKEPIQKELDRCWRQNMALPGRGAAFFDLWRRLTPHAVYARTIPILRSLLTCKRGLRADTLTSNLLRSIGLIMPELTGHIRTSYTSFPEAFVKTQGTLFQGIADEDEEAARRRWFYYLVYPIRAAFREVTGQR